MTYRIARIALASLFAVSTSHAQVVDAIFANGFDQPVVPFEAWQTNLEIHNEMRANVVPAASPSLAPLLWSPQVANAAQAHANRCVWAHSGVSAYGENLFARSGWLSIEGAAAATWAEEAADYNYSTNRCASGQQCGHYTQMIWGSTSELGCGTQQCSSGSPWGTGAWTIVVCNYRARGNVAGQRPY